MRFEILGAIRDVTVIASGRGIRIQQWLREQFGGQRWRKLKGIATIRDVMGCDGRRV